MSDRNVVPRSQAIFKRIFDIGVSGVGLLLAGWLIMLLVVIAALDTESNGLFRQARIGRRGELFWIYKIRTMKMNKGGTTVTAAGDPRITRLGGWLRRMKLDELPQLLNILKGEMSFVGPRPDVPGFADRLEGADRKVLAVRPGLTGPATLALRDEERVLAARADPEAFNREVLFPWKVAVNRRYVEQLSFKQDLRYLWATICPFAKHGLKLPTLTDRDAST